MTNYSILVTSPPYYGDAALRMASFIDGVLDNGDTVDNVFFYGEGVHHCNQFAVQTGDEFYSYEYWTQLSSSHNTALLVCVTAAIKRGVVSVDEAKDNGVDGANLVAPFQQAGLGEFFTALHACNRLVQF
ncbi:sulfurtransferase complex subunit TusD [Alteromonas sp. A079]|uniref:sulfurtransferase complex subunit TusD n=1 Tax=Alteromonas sp. A079 TaxID=3410268 RepID=UPI003BA20C60